MIQLGPALIEGRALVSSGDDRSVLSLPRSLQATVDYVSAGLLLLMKKMPAPSSFEASCVKIEKIE